MVVSCSPVNMSSLISEHLTLTLLQADFESKCILRMPLANRKIPKAVHYSLFLSSVCIMYNSNSKFSNFVQLTIKWLQYNFFLHTLLELISELKCVPSFLCAAPNHWQQFSARIATLN